MMKLQLERLTKQYGNKIAVDRISYDMTPGVYGLLGANGAGKTTLMRMICNILTPTSGEVKFNGVSHGAMGEEFRDKLGYLPQDFGYYPDFTAREFLLYIGALKGLMPRPARVKAMELLELVGLKAYEKKRIRTFSGGMRQRLGIAQAMLNDPDILILDEPTAGLDPKERVRFRNLISDLSKGKIVLLSTHIVSDVESIANEILLMKEGRFLMKGTVRELTQSVDGKVWECVVPRVQASDLEQSFGVANVYHEGDLARCRIISDDRPMDGALQVVPTLEDVYLYCFRDEIREVEIHG